LPHQNLVVVDPNPERYDWVCIDTETTGLHADTNEIIEVAAREFNMNRELGSSIVQLCSPQTGHIPESASRINGITYDMVRDMPHYHPEVHEVIARFLGQRTAVGHNFISFDKPFLRIHPVAEVDTLQMCRSRFPRGKNNLKAACLRMGIKWDDSEAHRALYDVDKCIELLWALKGITEAQIATRAQQTLFAAPEIAQEESKRPNYLNIGIKPTSEHAEMVATQSYSFSRIRLFRECAYRWYFEYILKIKQPEVNYLQVGNAAHEVIERSGTWCQRELFVNKFEAWCESENIVTPDEILASLSKDGATVTTRDVGYFIYADRDMLRKHYDDKGLSHLHYRMDNAIPNDSYESPAMPDMETYSKYIMRAVTNARIEDADTINDLEGIMWRFYRHKDFSKSMSIVALTEKKLAFDSNWKLVEDFYALNVFFRGIIDLVEYADDTVIITDYKTSRKMKTQKEMKNDMQLKVYVLLLSKFLPPNSFSRVTVRIEYMRHCETVEHTFENVEQVAEEALHWINTAIQDIESEMLKTGSDAFLPTRNEHCGMCHIGIDGKCPLFNKNLIQNIESDGFVVSNREECQLAWKRVEADKAEIQKLASQCKAFMKSYEGTVPIDEKATLDFWANQELKFDPFKTALLLLKKGFKLEDFLYSMSFPTSKFEKFAAAHDLVLTEQELAEVAKHSVKHTFDAYTPDQARNKDCLNAPEESDAEASE
jgi:DNA polymerase III subunit epsilon